MTRPNGREQADAMARLAKPLNTEQNAPAESAWQPDNLAGYRIGDLVRLPSMADALEVVALRPPSSLVLRTSTGKEVTAGWRAVSRAHLHPRAKR